MEMINVRKIQVRETGRLASGGLSVDITKKSSRDGLSGSVITLANQTAGALGKIVNEVAKAADLAHDIAAASNGQAAAIEQVD